MEFILHRCKTTDIYTHDIPYRSQRSQPTGTELDQVLDADPEGSRLGVMYLFLYYTTHTVIAWHSSTAFACIWHVY